MTNINALYSRRNRWFDRFDQGIVTKNEAFHFVLEILFDAPDNDTALQLCTDVPLWFAIEFQRELRQLAKTDFYYTVLSVRKDNRTAEEMHQNALCRQERLRWVASRFISTLRHFRITRRLSQKSANHRQDALA